MTETRIDTLTPELRNLLAADREIPAVPQDVRTRVLAGLQQERSDRVNWRGAVEPTQERAHPAKWRRRAITGAIVALAAMLALVYMLPTQTTMRLGMDESPIIEQRRIDPLSLPPDRALQKPVGVPKQPTAKRAKALQLQLLDHTTSKHKIDFYGHIGQDKNAKRLGIKVSQTYWTVGAHRISDMFIQAKAGMGPCQWRSSVTPTTRNKCKLTGRELIQGYLGVLYKQRPALAPDADHEHLFELINARRSGSFWRTHYAFSKVELDGNDVTKVKLVTGSATSSPAVVLTFGPKAAKHLATLTANNVGQRLAIVYDGTVHSSPVIHAAIVGGKASITMGSDLNTGRQSAQALVNSLTRP